MNDMHGFLVIFSGLPGVGKSSIARGLADALGGLYLRIDTIEQALRTTARLPEVIDDAGYRVAGAVAADNLVAGRSVVADSVNPIELTRAAWREVAAGARAKFLQVEVVCSDVEEHRRRVETRVTDIPGLKLPSWQDVLNREYEPWQGQPVVIVDTAKFSAAEAVAILKGVVDELRVRP